MREHEVYRSLIHGVVEASNLLQILYTPLVTAPISVPWVPTSKKALDELCNFISIKSNDIFYDLGCGDGRVVIEIAKRYGIKAVGIEVRPDLVEVARQNVLKEGVADKVEIIHGDFFKIPLYNATIVYAYLLTSVNKLLRPKLESELRPGAKVVTLDFKIPGWKPVAIREFRDRISRRLYLYIVGVSDRAYVV